MPLRINVLFFLRGKVRSEAPVGRHAPPPWQSRLSAAGPSAASAPSAPPAPPRRPLALALALCFFILSLTGCSPPADPNPGDTRLRVVCTTGIVADTVAQIGGPTVNVEALMGAGVDPHLYRATARDVARLLQADLVCYSGLHLEGKMIKALESLQHQGRTAIGVAEGLPKEKLLFSADFGDRPDPHVWFDVSLWAHTIDPIEKALCEKDPAHASEYRERAGSMRRRLHDLHRWCAERTGSLPVERRQLITSHDAFAYFGRAYDFKVVALQGISTVTEAGTQDVVNLIDFIKENRIPAIFVENSVSPLAVQRIASEAGVRIGGELCSDSLGPANSEEGTYEGMVRSNLNKIVEALKR